MFNLLKTLFSQNDLIDSKLFDEHTFYQAFIRDLKKCKKEVIIECPFITSARMEKLLLIFKELLRKEVKVHIITRDPAEHDEFFRDQATNEILMCYEMGIKITLLNGNFHRKLAILDRTIAWEGSLNILSQSFSREIMRRIESKKLTRHMFNFLKLEQVILKV